MEKFFRTYTHVNLGFRSLSFKKALYFIDIRLHEESSSEMNFRKISSHGTKEKLHKVYSPLII
jgi:hypothetical protein